MSGPSERDEIAAVLAKTLYEHSAASTFDATCGTCVREREHARTLSGPLLDWLAERDRRTAATALRRFADRFRVGDSNPWALHVRARARRTADRIERGE